MKKYIKNLAGFFVLLFIISTALYLVSTRNFHEEVFNKGNVYKNAEEINKIKDNVGRAKYIVNYFKTIGISPAAGNDSFIQEFKTINKASDKPEDTVNVLGKIQGKDKSEGYLILSSHVDGNAAETALILEIARVMKSQKYKPEKTVVFALWGDSEQSLKGSEYYTENPSFPLNKSQVILIDNFGKDICKNLFMITYGETGRALMGKLSSYSKFNGFSTAANENIYGNDDEAFLLKDVPAVLIQGDSKGNFWGDEKGAVYKDGVTTASSVLLNYIHRDIYKDNFHGLLSYSEMV
ncbi:MAG: M28 family peptidase, partial [Bacillota bacterium]|nr:M28 family peptidase [Bacillota bacterium]